MTTMTDSRAVEVLESIQLGVEMDRHNLEDGQNRLAALDHAIARLREPAEAQAQGGGEAAPEPFAWFAFADQNGPVPLEIYGWDRKACLYAVLTLARSEGWKGTVSGYLFHKGWTVRPAYTAPPSSPVGVELDAAALGRFAQDAWMDRHLEYPAWGRLTEAERAAWVAVGERIKRALAQQPAAVDGAMGEYSRGYKAGHAAATEYCVGLEKERRNA